MTYLLRYLKFLLRRQRSVKTQDGKTKTHKKMDKDDEGSNEHYYWVQVLDKRLYDSEPTCDTPTSDLPHQ